MLFRGVLLQFCYYLSDRQAQEQLNLHLATDADNELITTVTVIAGNMADSEIFEPLVNHNSREALLCWQGP